ncbi:4-hydroxyphenylpyruvate dioxygenase [Rickettsiales endosymbiont of Trichoplax sp. H2]|nr:4-hydroxyphenylpyruvate dioxygenase [Rickettsiales endosymbiont of Trichoplax sp. H2]MSO13390.1 4-hydroxyphenylpyruvate dioxygenase [Rickettsiales endosymbiont of Trichoplax sp. H2]
MLINIKYIEIYVANLVQSKFYYKKGFGFKEIYHNINKKSETEQSLLKLGNILLLLTSSKNSSSNINKEINIHGDAVKDIAFEVDNIELLMNNVNNFGIQILEQPKECLLFESEKIIKATIGAFGDTRHTLIQKINKDTTYIEEMHDNNISMSHIDHLAIAVDDFDCWRNYYKDIFGFYQSYKEKIETNFTGMDSIVMSLPNNEIKLVFVKPLKKKLTSQIDMFLKYNCSPGVQHVAFLTTNIINTLQILKNNGIELLDVPDSYYKNLSQNIKLNYKKVLNQLQNLNVLIDEENENFLLQVFTKPTQTRPTLFYEIIQREGAKNFGKNNITALFKAMEQQQKSNQEI